MQNTPEVSHGACAANASSYSCAGLCRGTHILLCVPAAIKGTYLEDRCFEIGVLIVVIELDVSFYEANLSMAPID